MKKMGWGHRFGGITVFLLSALCSDAYAINSGYEAEFKRSIQGATQNILTNGAVIASPSRVDPDYYYDWVRDTSLTMKALVKLAYHAKTDPQLKNELLSRLMTWIRWELNRQTVQKLTDLGEPRFYVDGRANNEPWGRPQNDGPALRALTAIEIAEHWIQEGRLSEVQKFLYRSELPAKTLIKRDLEYVAAHWNETSYDLWEEERAMHFYTLTTQKAALLKGADLADQMNDPAAATHYRLQVKGIQNLLDQFYDPTQGVIRYAINKVTPLPHKKSDLDIAVVLAAIQTFDGKFYVNEQQVQTTLNALAQQFSKIYAINKSKKNFAGAPLGVAYGRYPDDKYSGFDFSTGNPWFISTLAAAEFYCDLNQVKNKGKKSFSSNAQAQFDRVLYHMNQDGSLSEQFNRVNGYQQGAKDLTWSYTAYITAYQACFN